MPRHEAVNEAEVNELALVSSIVAWDVSKIDDTHLSGYSDLIIMVKLCGYSTFKILLILHFGHSANISECAHAFSKDLHFLDLWYSIQAVCWLTQIIMQMLMLKGSV